MFNLRAVTDEAKALEGKVVEDVEGREKELTDELKKFIDDFTTKIGGYLAVSGGGHFEQVAGRIGDKIWLAITSVARPTPVVSDAGPTNPPEASISTPPGSDASSDLVVEPIPQPAPLDPPTPAGQSSSTDDAMSAITPSPAGALTESPYQAPITVTPSSWSQAPAEQVQTAQGLPVPPEDPAAA